MKKFLIIVLAVALFSCTSLPDPQETNKGIVVFANEMDNKAKIDVLANFTMTIKGVKNNKVIQRSLPRKTGIVKFFLEPGVYEITDLKFVYDHSLSHVDCSEFIEDIGQFNVKKGEIKIIKKVLKTYTEFNNGENKGLIYYNVVDASNKDLKNIRNQIKDHKGSELWEIK